LPPTVKAYGKLLFNLQKNSIKKLFDLIDRMTDLIFY